MEVGKLYTEKRIPPSLRKTIYETFVSAISEEINDFRNQVARIKASFFDVKTMSRERLVALSDTFSIPFDVSIDDSLLFQQQEVLNIAFKIIYKGTPTLYRSFFQTIERFGEMFVYVYQESSQAISPSMMSPFDQASKTAMNKPFRWSSKGDFSGKVENWLGLDEQLTLDAGDSLWRLDTDSSEISTNHIGLEFFVDRIIKRNQKEYLMTADYLDYINKNMEFGRRCKEVPHIGSQLCIQTDQTGLMNSAFPEQDVSIPSLKLAVVGIPDIYSHITSEHDIVKVQFGIGSQSLPSVQNPSIPFPLELAKRISTIPVMFKNQLANNRFVGAVAEYTGQEADNIKILGKEVFDGILQTFAFSLPFAPIQKGNVKLTFILTDGTNLAIEDDRKGVLSSINGKGTINYDTGDCVLTTNFDRQQVDTLYQITTGEDQSVPAENPLLWEWTLQGGESTLPNSVWLAFSIGDGASQKTYTVQDDGLGNFIHPFIDKGTINYDTKKLKIIFTKALSLEKPFTATYLFHVSWTPEVGTELDASYFFTTNTVDITEVAFLNAANKILMYATFPPLEFNSTSYHATIMILVRKDEKNVPSDEPTDLL